MGMAVDNGLECFGDVGGRIDVVELAGGDDRREQGPVFCPDFMTGEESVFPGQADWPDGVLDRVGVELETPVFGAESRGCCKSKRLSWIKLECRAYQR